jgi:hypothetical protein
MKKLFGLVALGLLPALPTFAAVPTGDTQGRVQSVIVDHNAQRDYNSFLVFLSSPDNDRWDCISSKGYITVKSNSPGVTQDNYKQMFAVAIAAQASGKRLALSSSSADACNSVNQVWMID